MTTPSISAMPMPAIAQMQAQAAARAGGAGAAPAEADSKAMGMASFKELAGMGAAKPHGQGQPPRMPLLRRLSRTQAQQPAASDEHDTPLKSAAAQLIASLSHPDDDAESGRRREQTHDPLQQQTLLEQARQLLERQPDDGAGSRERLGAKLDAMQADLEARHGPALAQGRDYARALEGALASLSAADTTIGEGDGAGAGDDTLSALRRQFGAPAAGRRDAPLSPTALLEVLLRHAGPGTAATLGRPPARLHDKLRQSGGSGPRLWLSLRDASCFQLVNTSFALAGELRVALSEQAKLAPLSDQGELAGRLLRLGEPDGGQAEPLLRQLADLTKLTPRQRGAVCQALRDVVVRCPDGMWGGAEALPQRNRLLDQLRTMIEFHHAALPAASAAPEDALQARLRGGGHNPGSTPCKT